MKKILSLLLLLAGSVQAFDALPNPPINWFLGGGEIIGNGDLTCSQITVTGLTQYSIPYVGSGGLVSQDNSNLYYNPTGYSSGPNMEIGPEGSSLEDATFEAYNATAGQYTAHFHNTGAQGSAITNGALIGILDEPSGQSISAGNQLGCLLYGGSRTTTQIPGYGSRICANATDNYSLTDSASNLKFYTVPSASTTATLALTLGADQGTVAAQYVTAGTNFQLPTTSSTAGQLTINGTPALQEYGTANLFTGGAGNFTLTTGTAIDEVGEGSLALASLTSGASNTGVGYNAGHSISTGGDNTCIGSGACTAGTAIATGSGDTFLGFNAQGNSSSAGSSVAIGTSATVASSDVAIGAGTTATGADGVAIGQGTLATGNYATLIGQGISSGASMTVMAGTGVSGGSNSVVIGYDAQTYSNATGATAIGYDSNVQSMGGIAIGANAYSQNRSFVVGNGASGASDTANGQIVFGNSNNALNALYLGSGAVAVAAPSASSINVSPASGTNIAGASLTLNGGNSTGTGAGGQIIFQTAPAGSTGSSANTETTRMDIASTGNVGIGNTAPNALVDIGNASTLEGTLRLEGSTSGYVQLQTAVAAGSWTMTLPPNTGTSGYVLQTNGTGITSWVAPGAGSTFTPIAPTTQVFTSGSGTYYPDYAFTVSSANATAGATYTNNSVTYTVNTTISGGLVLYAWGNGAPTSSGTLTKASGTGDATITFSAAKLPLDLRIKAVSAGGGGGGSNASGTTGVTGGSTTLGSFLSCTGGVGGGGGGTTIAGGAGGICTVTTSGTILELTAPVVGGGGQTGIDTASFTAGYVVYAAGGVGGSSCFGGGGYSHPIATGGNGATNSGGGGSGGGSPTGGGIGAGGGGGGGCAELLDTAPASFSYSIGASASGGSGAGGYAGGSSGSGQASILEEYQ